MAIAEHFSTIEQIERHLPILQVIVPLFGAIITSMFRNGAIAWALALAVSWIAALNGIWLLHVAVQADAPISYVLGGWAAPWGIEYRIDSLNAFVVMLVTVIGAVIMPYAKQSVAHEIAPSHIAWFYTMYLLCLTGLLGIAVTGDAFNVFVFLEVSSLATYVLIAMGRDRRSLMAAYQYLILGTIGATFFVIGVGMLLLVTGSLNMADIAERLATASPEFYRPVMTALAFIAVGVCLKLALFPMHVWLPNAYAYAPSMATVFVAGTATKVAVYLLIRFFFSVYGPTRIENVEPLLDVLLVLSLAAMFLASFTAVFESNIKRLLAYSSVAQIGYITFGVSLMNEAGLTGGLAHIFNHALIKAALFMAVGAVFLRVGSVRIEAFAGLGRKMPVTMACFVLAGLGLIGVPGTAGFISKWYLALGALQSELWWLVFAIVASSLIAVVYVGRVVEAAYFREPSPDAASADLREAPLSMLVPLILITAATIYFGVDTRFSAEIAADTARMLLGGAP